MLFYSSGSAGQKDVRDIKLGVHDTKHRYSNYNTWLKRSYVPAWGFPVCVYNVSNRQQFWRAFCCDNHKKRERPKKRDKESQREGKRMKREREKKNLQRMSRMSRMSDGETERERELVDTVTDCGTDCG